MRGLALLGLVWLSLVGLAFSWTKEDHEIFDLVQALEDAEGKGTTFYSILGVPYTATTAEIGKAYRKKSLSMHPDKNPGVKNIEERYARLGVISKILREKEGRERYDFFYKNGVPKWRGTGYYYERFRPGLGSVLIFLALVTSGAQHGIAHVNRKRDLDRIYRLQKQAKLTAYGPKGLPLEKGVKRKVRVPISGADPAEDAGRNTGRMIDLMVDGTDVYVIGAHDPVPLDESMAPAPSFLDTWAIALVRKSFSALPLSKSAPPANGELPEDDINDGFTSESNAESSDTGRGKSEARKRKGASKKK
ncbi:DnaJ-domain-containing protein [Clavulina sp. PMI_390]|nr:DnaJ-domain-containing protein [Clavulina sp. PMI_390]